MTTCLKLFERKNNGNKIEIAISRLKYNYSNEVLLSYKIKFLYESKRKRRQINLIKTFIQSLSLIVSIISIAIVFLTQFQGQFSRLSDDYTSFVIQAVKELDESDKEFLKEKINEVDDIKKKKIADSLELGNSMGSFISYIYIGIIGVFFLGFFIMCYLEKHVCWYETLEAFIDKKMV